MLYKTKGIVLNTIKYSETSIIVRIFTEKFGMRSYIINGVRSSKTKGNKMAFYQPLNLLDLVVYNKENTGLQRISEVRIWKPYISIPFDFKKKAIVLFINEVLNKTLREESANEYMFDFLSETLVLLDQLPTNFHDFHLIFLAHLSNILGFGMPSAKQFVKEMQQYIPADFEEACLDTLLEAQYGQSISFTSLQRSTLLDAILIFYKFQVENFGELNSVAVLRELNH
jgi:DNA repair protein RecO (recombination protein O)